MQEVINSFLISFWALFFTIDAIGVAPIFVGLTASADDAYRTKMANKGVVITFAIFLLFALSGSIILDLFGISLSAFRIGGGVLLILLAIDMVLNKPSNNCSEYDTKVSEREDISVFPIGIPLLSGPASITIIILHMKQASGSPERQAAVALALVANLFICWLILRFAGKISKMLGKTGINVITRIFGILLTALACQFIIDGLREAFLK